MKVPKPRRLPSGAYFIQLRLGGQSIPVTASSERECRRAAELIKAEHRAGRRTSAPADPLTLGEAVDRYIESRAATVSPSTLDGYRRIRKNRFSAYMDTRLDRVPWQRAVNAERCAPKTMRNAWGLMRSVLTSNGITPPSVTLPGGASSRRAWLEPDQLPELIRAASGTPDALPVFLALSSLRRSEICGLTWQDVDLRRNTLTIRSTVVPSEAGFVARRGTKTAGSARTIPIMLPELRAALEAEPDRTGAVVRCSPQTVCHRINHACRAAGLPEAGTHGLRHSFASLAYHLGMSELETMEIGGWSDAGTMRKIYTHLAQQDRLEAENKIAEFFKNANGNANGD